MTSSIQSIGSSQTVLEFLRTKDLVEDLGVSLLNQDVFHQSDYVLRVGPIRIDIIVGRQIGYCFTCGED